MNYKNTIQELQKIGGNVVREGRAILKRNKTQTSRNTLYKDFDYLVTSSKSSVTLEFEFGRAEDYWEFVDEGVRGTSMPRPVNKDGKPYPRKKGRRASRSPFKFKGKMPPRRAIDRWIVGKPLKAARDDKGRFIERKSLAYLIQRSVFYNGIKRTQFFSRPFENQFKKREKKLVEAFANDIEQDIEKLLNLE